MPVDSCAELIMFAFVVGITALFVVVGLYEQIRSVIHAFAPSRSSKMPGSATRRLDLVGLSNRLPTRHEFARGSEIVR